MSTILLLCVLAAAVWLVLSLRERTPRSQSADSVDAYARALAALAPERPGARRRPRRRPSGASPRPSPRRPAATGPLAARPARRPDPRPASATPRRR